MARSAKWLEVFTWKMVTAQNEVLCLAKNALHKPTSDGHEETRELWEKCHREVMTLDEAVELCRRCHRMAPFCFYNGNTFASIMALVIKKLELDPEQHVIIRSLVGHIVAGWRRGKRRRRFGFFVNRSIDVSSIAVG
ncbi:MAG: hypothetical protein AAF591_00595 [Verrucomicrobiota bacterium]